MDLYKPAQIGECFGCGLPIYLEKTHTCPPCVDYGDDSVITTTAAKRIGNCNVCGLAVFEAVFHVCLEGQTSLHIPMGHRTPIEFAENDNIIPYIQRLQEELKTANETIKRLTRKKSGSSIRKQNDDLLESL
jgi:hypothetical protein